MKFQADKSNAPVVLQHDADSITLGLIKDGQPEKVTLSSSFILSSRGFWQPWPVPAWGDIAADSFAPIVQIAPQICIFGSGERLQFAPPQFLKDMLAARIGLETMGNAAACRTYNVLAAEGRDVTLALLLG